jgi:hypothetical protein
MSSRPYSATAIDCGGDLRLLSHVARDADGNAAFGDDLYCLLVCEISVAVGKHN